MAQDLETQRRAIAEQVAKAAPADALDLMWRFMALAGPVLERCDDGNGAVIDIFRTACADLGVLAEQARPDPTALADQTFEALLVNDYGQFDDIIPILAPALGAAGLEHLKRRMIELSNQPVKKPATKVRVQIGWASSGPIFADELAERSRVSTVRLALQGIADAQGDVDAFIAQYTEQARKMPRIATPIARRLLAAGRAEEALRTLEAVEVRTGPGGKSLDLDWEDARIEVLEGLGRADEAQKARWSCFERCLSAPHLRDYLKQLPDFDDIEAEDRALDLAERSGSCHQALAFLISWPSLDRAAGLVLRQANDLDGDCYELLTPAVEALAGKHPLAATILLRSMIDFTLNNNRTTRYKHAARHLLECGSLASSIPDFGAPESHEAYVARLRREHGRKSAFWGLVP
ncbi:DUF6880 family protein [Novispirillum sp. DQ9]|uniref:DUF6880 family protein n=1 Tax=Novispirillum sp. DQ9 TaxID=3398612 RepID=UPI003C7E66C6